jgi:hypothetical protein
MSTTDIDRQGDDNEGEGENLGPNSSNEEWLPEADAIDAADGTPDDDLELETEAPGESSDQLDLGEEDASLPWLEGDDDFEEEEGGGSFMMLALLALGALALIIGGIWWFTRERGDSDLVADGSLIEAPDQPYKEKPEDPGGKTFEGTGDTSYAVSEGEMRPVQLGDGAESPKPGFEAVGAPTAASPATKAPATPTKAASPAGAAPTVATSVAAGPGVQVGAYSSRAAAEAGWTRLTGAHSALKGVKYRVVEGKADIGTVYRLQALPGDAAAAKSLCATLKASGQDCAVKN